MVSHFLTKQILKQFQLRTKEAYELKIEQKTLFTV